MNKIMLPQEIEALEKYTQALNALTEALSRKSVNVPHDKELWSAEMCAAYIGVSKEYFAQYVASKPGFPPSAKIGHRKWIGQNVIYWALAHWDKQNIKRKSRTVTE